MNSQGITFVSRMVTETGAIPADVVRAFRIARDVTGAVDRWEDDRGAGRADRSRRAERADEGRRLAGRDHLALVPRAGARGSGSPMRSTPRSSPSPSSPRCSTRSGRTRGARSTSTIARRLIAEGVPEPRGAAPRLPGRAGARARHHRGRRMRPAGSRSRSPAGSSCWGSGSRSTGSSTSWRHCRRAPGGSGGPCSRWRTTCSRSAARLCERVLEHAGGAPIDEAVEASSRPATEAVAPPPAIPAQPRDRRASTDLLQLTVALRQVRALVG